MTPIGSLQPGMELNSDVHDQSGRLLAKAETIISDKHIKVLKTWGVTHADIKSDNNPAEIQLPSEPPSAENVSKAEALADKLFAQANREHPVMQQLYNICVQRNAVKFSAKEK